MVYLPRFTSPMDPMGKGTAQKMDLDSSTSEITLPETNSSHLKMDG